MSEIFDWGVLVAFVICAWLILRSVSPTEQQRRNPRRWLSAVIGVAVLFAVGAIVTVTGY